MLSWFIRIVMAVAGVIAGWLVASDAPNFGLFQMVISILLITLLVAAAAFWPLLVRWLKSRRRRNDRSA